MSLQPPNFVFTIPSIHDDTILSCRLYLPRNHSLCSHRAGLIRKAAVVAHPYAPLGGCYDDRIVEAVSAVLLKAGYVVGTFNFRGASGSAGHTSWSARPELGDYVSFYGFMLQYLHGLMAVEESPLPDVKGELAVMPSATGEGGFLPTSAHFPRLILAGYSYGALITSHLPEVSRMRSIFKLGSEGSAVSEICLRASNLSLRTLENIDTHYNRIHGPTSLQVPTPQLNSSSAHSSTSILVGGFESERTEHRISRDSRRSTEMRRSLDRVREKMHSRSHRLQRPVEGEADITSRLGSAQICYLFISPVLPPVAAFATLFSSLSRGCREEPGQGHNAGSELVLRPSLAIYGTNDFFTSAKRLRTWASRLGQKPGSAFQHREIDGAGHLWREPGVLEHMTKYITAWVSSLETAD